MKVHEKIKLLRENNHWTQDEMAQKLSMTTKGYAKIERGETISNLPKIEQIAEIFNMDICELLAHKEEIIENQKRELALLRDLVETLKNK
ncbi:helix-turn-helix domain-containing protein [Mannheimia haemolytica]|uniref:helix-turn-helix domain-containing protein n=1 Tax=Mannheimia haemolytica TaxID=75985 RepID=UPI00115CA4A8|nr:helix-turn-helix transcriptional regulator [Mannheimia haemolytica]TRC56110.1 helix-turn-helix transcriptional regulator [Mannheimia haemolytica]TRC64580.1 helix-turn-helix transcriptional regulator [Mannheimia haemolytica]